MREVKIKLIIAFFVSCVLTFIITTCGFWMLCKAFEILFTWERAFAVWFFINVATNVKVYAQFKKS